MQAEEEFRSRLRDDLERTSAPPVGTLVPDALGTGRRLRRRRQTMRAVAGTAAVAAVAVGSVTLSGAFGSNATSSAAIGPGSTAKPTASSPPSTRASSTPAPSTAATSSSATGTPVSIPASWTVPPAATVSDPAWVTPKAIVAEITKLLPSGTSTSPYSGDYAYGGGDPRELWAVDAKVTVTTPKGSTQMDVTLHKLSGTGATRCEQSSGCASEVLPDGSTVIVQHDWRPLGSGPKGAFVWVIRKDGMSAQVGVHDQGMLTDDQLFALASNSVWGSLKMDKSFVDHAEAFVHGIFMNPPTSG